MPPTVSLLSIRRIAFLAAVILPIWLSSCSSSRIPGLPDKLPEIALTGSTATPPHNMPGYEYPFDASGNYVSEWAAEGERKAGRSATANRDDVSKWGSSHGGRASSRSSSKARSGSKSKLAASKPVKKSTSTKGKGTVASKGKAGSPKSSVKKTAGTSTSSKSGSKSTAKSGSSSSKHTVKSTDNLYSLAKKYGTTEEKIKKANSLKSDKIRDGAVLKIPD